VIAAFASPMGVELSPINLGAASDTESAVSAFARGPHGSATVGNFHAHVLEDAMQLPRRHFLHLVAGAAALPVQASTSKVGRRVRRPRHDALGPTSQQRTSALCQAPARLCESGGSGPLHRA
jgi:hypothetical protein